MDNLLIDRETLARVIDGLIKQKPLAVDNAEELNALREEAIKKLDDKIGISIFSQLNEEQNREINQLFDRSEESEEVFKDFFDKAGIDIEATITRAISEFSDEFLERRQNA